MTLTSNVNLEHRLVIGLAGRAITFKFKGSGAKVIHVKFISAGKVTMQNNHPAFQNNLVPIEKIIFLKHLSQLRRTRHIPVSNKLSSCLCYSGHASFIKLN